VLYLSLTSNPFDIGVGFLYEDKVYHAFAYFVLMFWFAQIYHNRFQRNMIAMVLVFMGIMLEYLQSFNASRFSELGDFLANATGVALGFSLALTSAKNWLIKIEALII
jgi:VanZ family protein